MNARVALGQSLTQTQMATFPRAPPLMFASGSLGTSDNGGGGAESPGGVGGIVHTGNSHHIRATPSYGPMTSSATGSVVGGMNGGGGSTGGSGVMS